MCSPEVSVLRSGGMCNEYRKCCYFCEYILECYIRWEDYHWRDCKKYKGSFGCSAVKEFIEENGLFKLENPSHLEGMV